MHRATLAATVVIALVACRPPGDGDPIGGNECFVSEECIEGEVCARDGICYRAENVRMVKATWTIAGVVASEASCSAHPDLHIRFDGANVADDLGFAPVPCATGQFFVDRLPRSFTFVELRADNQSSPRDSSMIDASGMAALDLAF